MARLSLLSFLSAKTPTPAPTTTTTTTTTATANPTTTATTASCCASSSSSNPPTPGSEPTSDTSPDDLLTPATSQSESESVDVAKQRTTQQEQEQEQEQEQRVSRRVTRSSLGHEIEQERKAGSEERTEGVDASAEGGVIAQEESGARARASRLKYSSSKAVEGGGIEDIAKEREERDSTTAAPRRVTRRSLRAGITATTTDTVGDGAVGKEEVSGTGQPENGESEEAKGNEKTEPAEGNGLANTSRRRSMRLSILEKTTGVLDKASSVLGKRSLETSKSKSKEPDRRASLRSRNVVKEPPPSSAPEEPAAKKQRISDSGNTASKSSSSKPASAKEEEEAPKPKPSPPKRKKWLSHGLYVGQDRYFDPRLTEAANRRKHGKENEKDRRKIFPLPMFAGERLLEDGRDFKLPFDIFSPLPMGQPKPDEWRKTNKNVFVGDAASIWKATKLGEESTCMCTPETGCDENCQNRYMFYECDDRNCKLGEERCGNRSFSGLRQRIKAGRKYNIGVEVIKTGDRGYGVRSNRTFEPNQIIVEYTGEILTQEECEKRMRTVYKNNECYYLMYFDQNMIIDATRGSIARFVNHSCEPNCRMEKWTVSGKPRMALFAGDNGIMTGQELTYDYNFDPYSAKNVQECRCGAPTCRGILGPKPKDKRTSETQGKKGSSKSSTAATRGTKKKRKRTNDNDNDNALDESSTSRLNKRRRILKPAKAKAALKAGVAKAVSRVRRAARGGGKAATTTGSNKTKAATSPKAKGKTNSKANIAIKAKTTNSRKKVIMPSKSKPQQQQQQRKTPTTTTTKKTKKNSSSTTRSKPQSNTSKLNMPSKPRIRNSITAARSGENAKTPTAMRRFLEKGKELLSSERGTAPSSSSKSAASVKRAVGRVVGIGGAAGRRGRGK
ncbi:hypothetical protein AJ80_01676 [Polytolypa hystricis UAMH7299]|uniref:Histone-lysine N-methyltransferase ASH1L n=1 Tax=Polytolypa hystricis (strain UAMH7299) TaxID=1447883 RepID=A0A2B7YZZ0_POLH7|nr:hypothetical protein AJ80_01676 [Polytolypa hystricis UAMH7299]